MPRTKTPISPKQLAANRANAAKFTGPKSQEGSFRVTTVTDPLEQSVQLEDVQRLAGRPYPRTTCIYDRRGRKITRNVVERILD